MFSASAQDWPNIFFPVDLNRSSHQGCSMKNVLLRNFTKFTGKRLCQSLFFNKVAGLRPATLLKKRLWHSCFPVNFGKFLSTPFLQNTFGRLFLSEGHKSIHFLISIKFCLEWCIIRLLSKKFIFERFFRVQKIGLLIIAQ